VLLAKNEFGQVHQVELSKGLPALVIEHSLTNAKVSLYGGQVLSWQPKAERDVFWLSNDSAFEVGKAIRGGIPLCWPWFGTHPDDAENKFGNHGFARTSLWEVDTIDITNQGVEVSLYLKRKNVNDLWPFACQLKQTLFFGRTFKQNLQMKNFSDLDAYYTGALHSYFSISSPKAIKVDELSHATFDDKLTGKTHSPKLLKNGLGPVDRIYHTNNKVKIVDNVWKRAIEIKAKNTQQWVFWNPGIEIANNMVDIHQDGEQEFICLEAANTQMQLLPAGKCLAIEQEISILNY
jgi:glucose-6-phosphate 1-epimerase